MFIPKKEEKKNKIQSCSAFMESLMVRMFTGLAGVPGQQGEQARLHVRPVDAVPQPGRPPAAAGDGGRCVDGSHQVSRVALSNSPTTQISTGSSKAQ